MTVPGSVSLALVHHPVLDRAGEVVTTAITNLDLHDMSRSARTYGLKSLFVTHPVLAQRMLAARIREHWVLGSGKKRIPDRAEALELVTIVSCLDEVYQSVGGAAGRAGLELWTTGASARHGSVVRYSDAKLRLASASLPVVIVFGTGWGLAPEVMQSADVRLEPIQSTVDTGYNHLSVRAACAITLDRLFFSEPSYRPGV